MTLNIYVHQESLAHRIRHFGRLARESWQVAKRLNDLLPERLRRLKYSQSADITRSKAERLALVDEYYHHSVQEYLNMYKNGVEARIQYETHLMLYQARCSLRKKPF
ncbi:MAG: hypothetical protein AB7T49_13660 [Oligoflexales bacterium]